MGDVELEAAAALYTAATLEQLEPFTLADRIVELWLQRGVPIGPTGPASQALDRYWLQRGERLPDAERRAIYERVFDERFNGELWPVLLAALADRAPGAGARAGDVRAHFAAAIDETVLAATPALHAQLDRALDVLDSPEIREGYGARDLWQLLDHLGRMELGRTPDSGRAQTLAASGTAVIAWLADRDAEVPEEIADAARSWLAMAAPPGA